MSSIILYTGVPGAGKTLRSIFDGIKEKAKGRLVYTFGIDGMNPDVLETAPISSIEDWRKLPAGSILIVDEAHKFFPIRSPGKPPQWIQDLTEIRHYGIELWLITQDPRNIDSFVRRLIGNHFHLSRKMGLKGAVVWEFQGVSEDPNDFHNRQNSVKTSWLYPKHLFSAYKSASLHVVKPRIPFKFILMVLLVVSCVVFIPFVIYKVYYSVDNVVTSSSKSTSSVSSSNTLSNNSNASVKTKELTREEYIKSITPIVPYVPYTAPIYSDLLVPTEIPILLCVIGGHTESKNRTCNCYTEQGTRYNNVPQPVCESYALNGFYNPYRRNSSSNSSVQKTIE